MRCYRTPVVCSEDTQMSAEFMTNTLRNKQIDKLRMYRSAMIISQAETDSTGYNQMSGKEMTGIFEEGALSRLIVEGNARTIYYVPEDSLRTMGINYAENARTILDRKSVVEGKSGSVSVVLGGGRILKKKK